MSHVTAKDRLIVALDMPTVEEAQRLVVKLGPEVTFYKVGLELLFSGGLELARALKVRGQARLPRHEALGHRQHGRAGGGECDRARRRFPHRARARPEDAARGDNRAWQEPVEAARGHRAHQPDGRRLEAAGLITCTRRSRADARQARARIRASTGSSARARRRRASARRWVLGFSS